MSKVSKQAASGLFLRRGTKGLNVRAGLGGIHRCYIGIMEKNMAVFRVQDSGFRVLRVEDLEFSHVRASN